MMMDSREIVVDTMTPLGLSVLCEYRGHYRPAPEVRGAFHKADAQGLGYNRSRSGSGAVDQYHSPLNDLFDDPATCPEKYLLWFHHLPWDHPMASGRTLWDELCLRYAAGVEGAARLRRSWNGLRGRIDEQRFAEVAAKLEIQERDSVLWRDTCINYFQQFSGLPMPADIAQQERNQEQ
jgi:alpha-glucuronidase